MLLHVFILLGSPGAGKSTQAQLLQERLGYKWISTGNLARSSTDPEIVEVIERGDLLSNQLIQRMLEDEIKKTPADIELMIDGYPRDDEQIDVMTNYIAKVHRPIKAAIYIELEKEEAIERLVARGRKDDDPAVIRHRIENIFDKEITPIIKGFEDNDIEIVRADGNGTEEEVYERLEGIVLRFDPNGGKR